MTAYLPVVAVTAVLLAWPPRLPRRAWSRSRRWTAPGSPAARHGGTEELVWLESLVSELSAGRDPASALVVVPSSWTVCPEAAAAARGGADVAAAMRAHARGPVVAGAAACWEVAHGAGAGLADALATLADAARETERVRHELRAGLAEPRATAVVLAALPVLGLGLGSALGADPFSWLVGSSPGRLVLTAGLLLEAIGTVWSWRITRSLEEAL